MKLHIDRRRFLICVVITWLVGAVSSPSLCANGPVKEMRIRMQAVCWNVCRSIAPTDPSAGPFTIDKIAGAKKSTLRRWLKTCPPPSFDDLCGTWRGLNRGIGPAMIGISQFNKQICSHGCGGHGDNITIQQTPPKDWGCKHNWQVVVKDGKIDRSGNYIVKLPNGERPSPQGIVFDYSEAENPALDPSRFLIDKIVKLDDRHLLGRAMMQVGRLKMHVSYFVLERAH